MSILVTRAGKGSPLTHNEVDANFTNLNNDKVEGQSSSVDSEIALFSGTGGKTIKRASITGVLKAVSGVLSAAVAGTDYETPANKDATGGYTGLTLYKINFKNATNTFISFFTNSNTAARTYTFPDKDGTVAMTSDIITTGWLAPKTAAYTAMAGDMVDTDTTAGSFAITLPGTAVAVGDPVSVRGKAWETNPISITPPTGGSIEGPGGTSTASETCSNSSLILKFVCIDATAGAMKWRVAI